MICYIGHKMESFHGMEHAFLSSLSMLSLEFMLQCCMFLSFRGTIMLLTFCTLSFCAGLTRWGISRGRMDVSVVDFVGHVKVLVLERSTVLRGRARSDWNSVSEGDSAMIPQT